MSNPLKFIFETSHQATQPKEDQTPEDFHVKLDSFSIKVKRLLGFYLYPLKNALEKNMLFEKLKRVQGFKDIKRTPDVLAVGHKGFGQEIFLNRIRKRIVGKPKVILCYGCGMGDEVENIAKIFKPERIIGIDYFNFSSYWQEISQRVYARHKVKVDFYQHEYDKPNDALFQVADLVYSHAVLEHLIDMDGIFKILRSFLKKGGYFSAQWGPMWNSYSGDHISGELGLECGFKHLQLTADDYIKYYKKHPRNIESVAAGSPTWLEMGLHNFSTYKEYIQALHFFFGDIIYLQWVLSNESFRFKSLHADQWKEILEMHRELNELDLTLQCAGILLGPSKGKNVY